MQAMACSLPEFLLELFCNTWEHGAETPQIVPTESGSMFGHATTNLVNRYENHELWSLCGP